MAPIDDIKRFVKNAPQEYTSKTTVSHLDSIIDAMIDDLHAGTNMERSEIEESITKFELSRRGVSSIALSRGRGGFGHGPIPIPHTCHKKIELCWPHPEDEDLIVCLEIEIPWPCPDEPKFI